MKRHAFVLAALAAALIFSVQSLDSETARRSFIGQVLLDSQDNPGNPLLDSGAESQNLDFPPEFFPILPWDPFHGWKEPFLMERKWGLESIVDCGFSMAGFVWPEDLPLCEKLGLKALVIADRVFLSPKDWMKLQDAEIEAKIKAVVEKTANSPAVLGYFITDEPGASDFPALAKAVAAVKRHAPGKLAYINLFPDYATMGEVGRSQLETATYSDYLERFAQEVRPQFISYDNYQVEYSADLKDAEKTASYFRNLLEIRRVGLKYGLPFWNIVASNQLAAFANIPSPSSLLLQAYTTLAAGGRGVSWYTYYSQGYKYAPIDEAGEKTLTWHYLREVNRQVAALGPTMNRLKSTGVYFTSPPPAAGLPTLPGKTVSEVISDGPMMIGEFARGEPRQGSSGDSISDFGDEAFVLVVNISLERSLKFKLRTSALFKKAEIVSAVDGRLVPLDLEDETWLVAGQGILIRLSS